MILQNIEAIYPLSPFQASLLSGDLRAHNPSAYCRQMICSLYGQLDTEAFERAWRLIISQHPILRTTFVWKNLRKPVQLVHRQIDFSLLQHDWRGLSSEQQQELLDTLLDAEREEGFRATEAPLMRLCLCRLSDDDYYLLWSYDLLVLDNWSLPLLLEKAVAVYEGQLKGEIPQVEQGRLYQDYIAWLKQQDITQAEAFWKESLKGLDGLDNLNGLFQHTSSTNDDANDNVHVQMPFGLTDSLRELASEHQLDFQALVQGAWALLLSRYSGENEIVYAATVSGRPADLTGANLMIGPFNNVLPIHVRVSSSTPVLGWLKSLSSHLEELRRYSFYPVSRWSNNNGAPSFASTVQIESSPSNGILHEDGASLHVRQIQTVEQTKSPVTLIAPSHSEATLQLSYNPATLDRTSAVRLTQHFENLLMGILQQPHIPISHLSILSAPELDQLLYSFNDTIAPLPQTSIHALFQQQVLREPDAIALSFLGRTLTYLELDRRSNQLAHHLLSLGVSPDSLVAVCLDRSLELFIALLAILKAGAAYLPLDPSYPLARLSFMLADAGSPLLLTTEVLADELPAQWTLPLLLDADWDVIALNPDEPLLETVVSTAQLAYVMYTSGSTGTPKGVAVTHGGVVRLVTSPNYVRLDQKQTLLQLAPMTFDASTLEIWGALLNCGRLVVMPPIAPTLDEISEVIVDERVTTLWLTAGLFHLMVDEQLEDLSQVGQLLAGGDVLSVHHVEKYLAAIDGSERRLINGYGPTENTTFTCCHVMDGQTGLNGSVPIGRPITNTQVYVLDAEMQVAPMGVVGELYIGGAGLARGYFNQPELTAETFVPHPHSTEAGDRLYRTGDMVRWGEKGELEFIGRIDGQVKIRGFRIEVGEIEAVLSAHAGVREAVVLVREDERGDKRLAAYVVKAGGSEVTAGELRDYLRERLPEYMQVQWVVEVEELPLTANGKVDRRALQALEMEFERSQIVMARTPAEEILSAIWAEVLGRETVSVHDNFFELGGHSLLATQVISRVRDAFGQEVALRSLFEQPSVAGLAREIEAGRGAELHAPPLEPVERAERLPLSFAQQRLWFLDQLEPGSSFYNIPTAVRLTGQLNVAALERTLSEIIRRHEVLRTHFIAIDGEPVQVIEAATPIKLEVLDLSALEKEAREAEMQRLMQVEVSLPFDLSRGPLLHVSLLRLGADEHVAIVTMHHIVSDGWSIGIFINEVAALYKAFIAGDESPLAELPVQYADFAHWQRSWLEGEVLAKQLDYWRDELSDAPTVIDLPIDKPRPPVQTYHGAHYPLELSAELSAQLRDLSRRNGSTLFMTLLAAFDILLSRYAGQDQVLVGTPIANRNRSETEGLIGFFVNTLVLRGDMRGNPSFRELLRRVRETALGAYAHQDLPFEKLVEELQPERDMSRSPLFQVMFALQNAPINALELPGLTLSSIPIGGAEAKFDLGLDLQDVAGYIAGAIEYNVDLFETATIVRLNEHFKTLLQSIVANIERPLAELALLSAAEETQLLYEWNDEPASLDPHLFVHGLFETQAARNPEAVAVTSENQQFTYGELNRRANKLAHYLQSLDVGPEVVVGICVEPSPEMLVAFLATLKSGGAYLPLDPKYPHERLSLMIKDTQARVLLTYERLRPLVSGYDAKVICLDTDWETIASEPDDNPSRDLLSVANQAFIIYTSGSTGKPKGVMLTHGGLVNYIQAVSDTCHFNSADRVLQFFSISFDAFAEEVYGALTSGATLVLRTEEMLSSPQVFLRQCRELEITVLDLPTAYWHELTAGSTAEDWSLERLRLVILGGEIALAQHVLTWRTLAGEQIHLNNGYGPTETTIAATWYIPPAQIDELTFVSAGLPIGRPMRNLQAYVLDKYLQPVPIGVSGELHLGGAGLARGYLNNPAFTAERFIPHPFSRQPGAFLYKTGDVARYLPGGDLLMTGRRDQQVKIRGFRVELGEVETALTRHAAIRECVVVAQATSASSKRLVAYVVQDQESATTTSELRQYLKGNLPDYMIPSVFVTLAELPLTQNGKVDRRALPEPDTAGTGLGTDFIAPRTPVEELVAAIWAEVLELERISVVDNFFDLGGHSLLATQVISRVRDAFGQEVALRQIFEHPTVSELSRSIVLAQQADDGLEAPRITRVPRDERLPLSFAQERLWFLDQLEPGTPFYNIPVAVRLTGQLDLEALERTLLEVTRRHEVLRTTFAIVDGEPVQIISPPSRVIESIVDLSAFSREEREAETARFVQEEAQRPFDLRNGPLLRVSLLRLTAAEHVALATMHHIVSDGWSMGIFINDVATLYRAFSSGEESPLEALPIQYADFAHWQRNWLQGEVLAKQLAYWRDELADAPAILELPIDKPRPPLQTFNGAGHPVVLSPELTQQLKELCRNEKVTLFMALLAAFDVLLHHYTRQVDILVGTVIANRNRAEIEPLIGFFVNLLVMRADMAGHPSFRELLQRVRETALGAYAHQDLPFEKLVEELQPERGMSRAPLFQATFVLQNTPEQELELPGLSLSAEPVNYSIVKYDLSFDVGEIDGRIAGALGYNIDLFDAHTIERLTQHFENLLTGILQQPHVPISQLSILSRPELEQLLFSFNDTVAPRGHTSIHARFQEQVLRAPDAVALSLLDSSLTYLELDRRSNQLAHHLVSLGVSRDSIVAVCLDRSLELFIALLAILKAGAAYLPLDPSYPLARLSFMLADAGSPLLLTTETLADELPAQWTLPLLLDADWGVIALNKDEPLPETVVSADQLAYVMYTSGSTGTPKGVAVTHGGVLRLVTEPNYVRLDQKQTLLQLAPMTFDASTLEVWGALLNGGRLVVMPPSTPTLDEISRVIVDQEVTTLWLTAGLFHLMVDEQLEGLSQVDQLLAGGDVLSVRHVETYLAAIDGSERRLINGYGPTENTTFTCCHVMDGQTRLNGSVPIGRPITNTQVYVLDAEMQVAPMGVVGELYIGGTGLARGYFNKPELTAERFVPHPHSTEAGERLYRTGDMVRWRKKGELEFIGRIDGQVKIRGFRIEVGEIEAVLVAHAGVREAVVLVREDERGDKRLVAYVVKAAESEVTAGELKDYLRERLPEYMQVQWVVEVDELPLTANGKVDRRALQALEIEIAGGESVQARTPVEEILSAIWAEVLGRETVSVHDNFFEIGGHSLLATQVISRIRDAFGQEVALRSLFEQPSVAGLASEIEAGRGAELHAPPLERVERAQRLPLSFAQQRLWFLDQLEPGSSFYNIPVAVRLRGVLNVEALERTLSEVVRRHEVLRTHFISIGGEPVQVIEAAAPIKLEVLNLSALDEAERTAETERLVVEEESARGFDLTTGPTLRMSLIRLGAEEHVALVTMHHIVSDGWSIGIFINEVVALYKAFIAGEESPLDELPIQYADFAHWQRNWLQGEVLAAQLDYWRAQLADAPHIIDLPIDKPRPLVQTYRGALHPIDLSLELTQQLKELCRNEKVTLFMALLAAFDVLLSRYTGQEEILIGTPIANRNRSETEGLIGFFVNTLVLRGDMRGNPSFGELLRRVREVALGAYAHQDLPFEKLVEELQPERDMSRSPLFQVMFALQNAPSSTLELPDLTLSAIPVENTTAKFDLGLDLQEVDGCIAGAFDYNIDLFEAATIARLSEHFQMLLQSVVAHVERPVAELTLLSVAEVTQLLFEWNDEPLSLDPHRFIHGLFETQAALNPQAVAVVSEHEQLTYGELNRRANQLAHHLQSLGVGPEVVVGICVERSPEMLVAMLGTLKSGAAYLPLDPTHPEDRLSLMIADAQVRVLLTYKRLHGLVAGHEAKVICLDTGWETIASEPDGNPANGLLSVANQAYIIYTSGSTGRPNGVMVTHGGLVNYIELFNETWQITSEDRVLQFASISFDTSAEEIYGALTSGATLVLRTDEMLSSPQVFLRQCRELEITVLDLPTAYWHELTAGSTAEDWSLERMRLVILGGEMALARHLVTWRRLAGEKVQLFNGYGPTETTIVATWWFAPAQLDELTLGSAGVSIGRPVRNLQAYVLDKYLQPVPIGVSGEIHLGGAGLARGYLNNPALTAERFIPHPFSRQAGARLYKTGDVAGYLPNGDLIVTGRTDQQVKIRGFRVELGEVETAITRHPAIRECVVVAKAESTGSKRLIAYVVPHQESTTSTSELRGYLKGNLPDYMIPSAFVTLAELPLTSNNKVDRRALQAMEVELEAGGEGVLARTPVEEIVSAIWAEVLGRETVGVHDNFFDLGGHSLLATQVISRVRDAFGQEVALRSLFEQPTVAGLASEIEAGRGAEWQAPPLERVERAERLPLSFAQQRLWFLDQLEPGSSFYNIPAAVRLHGVLNVEALERTLSEVVRRHEVLRTHFVSVDGEPVQVIEAAAPIKLEVLDLSDLDEAERTAETERLVAEESARPFDLSLGPLLRLSLLRLQEDEHVALVMMHHIVSDGWSMGILIREVAALYGAYLRGEESPLDELPIQYADFAHWQRNWLQGKVLDAQLDYWRAELADAPTVIDLPIDKPRPPVQTYRGAYHPLQLSAELSSQLKDLSRQNGSTLFMTLLAAFDLLLCRYAGQEQVLVGTPIANRNRSETEGLIGFFVNTLVLRGDVRGNPSFRELLRRVRETALGAYAHQDLPFEKLVEELQPERNMSRSPLFQVMFILQNAPSEALELEGLRLSEMESAGETAKFELTLALEESGGVIMGAVEYNRDLYEAETIRRLVESYERVLQAVVTNAEQRVFEIDLLSEVEHQQIIQGWNDTAREYRSAGGMHRLFEAQVECIPAATALVFGDQRLSYGELNERANSLAHYLRELGVAAEDRIGILMERSPAMVVSLLGVLKAGCCYVPLDPQYPRERLKFMQTDAGVRVLLTTGALAEACGVEPSEQLRLVQVEGVEQTASSENPSVAGSEQQLAYLIYTSGSTGVPKGVAITHGSAETFLHWARETFNQQVLSGVLFSTSICFDLSIFELFVTLSNGGKVILAENALQLPELAAASQVTLINTVPSAMAELVRLRAVPESVRVVNLAGEALSKELVAEIYATTAVQTVYNLYGPSEDTTYSTFTATREGELVTIGRPIANTRAYVLDAHQQCVPIGVAGELYLGGAGLARGYFARPEMTAEKFIPDRFSQTAGDRLYRTGDLARYRDNGELEFLGRADHQVKVRGYRIELGEIESVLRQQDQVQQAIVVIRQERLVAYVVSEGVSSVELRERLRQCLPEYMVPSAFVLLERMPLTPNGKVDRRALPDPDATSLVPGSGYVPPRTVVEEIVVSIWSQLLAVERIGVEDNFFELGGHSLLATQVISRVRDAFGQEVALRSLFEQPTVAGLAQTIERAQRANVGLIAPPLVPISRDTVLPLSFAQQRLWFLDQMEPGSSFYNIPAAVRLHGTLNIEALERTLSEVVRRHEVLRTRFISIDGEPAQVIEPATPIKLEVLDLSDLEEAERTAETQRIVAEESVRPFDLTTGPLLRMNLLRLGAEEHVALVTMHHIVSDGWSIGVLVREVAALYSAYLKGEESPLEELPIQYADFAHWQRNWLQGEVLAAQLDYWRAELADTPTAIDLPVYKPRPPVQTYRGAHHQLQLSAELSSQLKDLSRQNGSTLFMTLLAAFDLLLCRYAGQEQVLVGTPIANRNRSETEGLIGFFVNTLVLRGDVRGNPSFRELLRQVREAALGAYAHQDLPFEKLVEELQPERDMSRSPLFQVMFLLQNAPSEALELEGLSLSGVENAGETARFELSLGLQEDGDGVIVGGMEYNVDLFEAETMGRLVESYKRVLHAVVTDAEQRVFEIDLLSDAERRQILEGWNDTAAAYPRELTLSELFEAQVARTPDTVALLFEDTTLSYRELNERANQLAHYLQRIGVGREVLVGILMPRSVEMIVAVLGVLKAGGAYVPLDPTYPVERIAFMVHDSEMRLLLTQRDLLANVPELKATMIALDEEWEQIAGQSAVNPPVLTTPDNLAYVIYTSGSTGKPKGVQIQQRSLINFLTAMVNRPGLTTGDVLLSVTSLSFDIAGLELFLPLINGARVVLASREETMDAGLLMARLETSGATVMQATPATWSLLLEAGWHGDKDLQALCGGEAMSPKLAQELAARSRELWNLYGPTETTIWSSVSKVNGTSPVTLGVPIANTQFYVLDRHVEPVPIGVVGELYIAGDGLARGYLKRPELTAEKFVANPFSTTPGARLYRTGDLVRYRREGELEYLGRLDQQVKVRGFRIELGEIEAALNNHPEITESVVLVQQDKHGEKRLVAYIVAANKPESKLREYLRERLPEYMVPQVFVPLVALPLTPNGKVDRRALQAVEIEGESLIEPRDVVELQLAHIWEELLDVRHVGVRDDFFSLGGHSLLAVRLMARIEASFGQHLPLASLFQGPTVEKLASLLRVQAHKQEAPALVNIQPNGDGLPFFCVHPVGGNVLCYQALSKHLGFERPFYGLQARGLDENQVPHTRIEDMAAYYIEAIRSVQPDGPYLLGGWSMGGVVAYEMAQQLEAQQQRVSLLALMDSRPFVEDAGAWDELTLLINFAHDLGLPVDGLNLSTDELAKLDSEELLNYVLQRAIDVGIVPEDIQLAHARKLFEVFKINVQAMQSYRPQASSQRVTLLKAEGQGTVKATDQTMGWGALTSGEVEVYTVPGSHYTIVREPHVRSLAEHLADSINRATLKSFASLP